MVPGGWYCTGGLWEPWLRWYCAGAVGSPGFAGTVLGRAVGSPGFGTGSPGFAGTVLGAMGSPGFAGTVLGGCGEPWLCWYCARGLWGALALLVLCWGAVGSPGFTGTVLRGYGEPWLCWYCAGGCGEPWLCQYCTGELWGALASLVLCWGAVGSPGFAGKLRNKFLKLPECSNHSKYCFTSL